MTLREQLAGGRAAFADGLARFDQARRNGLVNPRDCHKDAARARQDDGWAALAEWLVSIRTGRPWLARVYVGRKDTGEDVAGLQVKHTRYWTGSLVAHTSDRRDLPYVLVVGDCFPGLVIAGWATFAEATRPGNWRADVQHPAFFLRQPLHPIETLPPYEDEVPPR